MEEKKFKPKISSRSPTRRNSDRQPGDEVGLSGGGVGRQRVGLLHRDRFRRRQRDLGGRPEGLALRLRRVHQKVLQGQPR